MVEEVEEVVAVVPMDVEEEAEVSLEDLLTLHSIINNNFNNFWKKQTLLSFP